MKRIAAALLLATAAMPASAQTLSLSPQGYFEARGANVLVFSNWYDGLFADSKISGVEIVQQDVRTATNGDVRLSATPGQWDPIGALVSRNVDATRGAIEAVLEYKDYGFRYRIRAERRGEAVVIAVILDQPLPAALAGKAGFNLEFLPSAYFHHSYFADGQPGTFPLHPSSDMRSGGERNAASGRNIGAGAEPLPLATGSNFVLAPEDPNRRVTITGNAPINLYDGRDQAQNGWFVLRSELPANKTGRVVEWTIAPNSVADYVRKPVIGHSQLGYTPEQAKVAVIELDRNATPTGPAKLLRVNADGGFTEAAAAEPKPWGDYLRYSYRIFDFSQVKAPGLYCLEYSGTRTATFRIAPDLYARAWYPTNDVYMPVAMDHMFVNEAYRVWHGDPHRDDAKQAPLNHDHIDLYAQGPTTDTRFAPGEHIPGLNVGGWLDAGDFDLRTQTNYGVVRELVDIWETWKPLRDQTLVDQSKRHVEIHVPDGSPDILQQIEHGTLQLIAQFGAVGHAIHGIVEPDVAQYTHLGDAASKTDGVPGTDDDRWAFTTKVSALNYGSIAAIAAASRALKEFRPELSAKGIALARRIWDEEHSHAPDLYSHGNTTGGPIDSEEFGAAVELLVATGDKKYEDRVAALLPAMAKRFPFGLTTAIDAIPHMPASYKAAIRAAIVDFQKRPPFGRANPYGVPITEGGWAGNGLVVNLGITDYAIHRAFPDLSNGDTVFRALDYLHGTHPGSDISFVSGVGTVSKEVAYGSNRADFSYIAGGVVPGVLIIKPDLPENSEQWPFFWGENEYVVNLGPSYIALVHAADDVAKERGKR
ncbi:glycoside hydrolase family 9 protein [Sphingomonas sp. LB-2]|uniref:glycoside hydrolase family 9 protein n=1 Tax=Sphingomonas caeni TaxID=2984949 RepID=UPI00223177DE|nr:glycoside hydrolase family 9 protein [Sphingomonas caeni]MCW3846311.1 glycoside hydrolase family 9 protein [Sphingomonas caeni]